MLEEALTSIVGTIDVREAYNSFHYLEQRREKTNSSTLQTGMP
ncbi:hypothetical protein SB6413_02542 [Klebsiella pasteurii]|nr:hypothetical protein SB6413_02542 [Klebsiella pasteurii]